MILAAQIWAARHMADRIRKTTSFIEKTKYTRYLVICWKVFPHSTGYSNFWTILL